MRDRTGSLPQRNLHSLLHVIIISTLALACGGSSGPDPVGADAGGAGEVAADAGPAPEKLTGWISVIESNDTCDHWYLRSDWYGGVRAHFAEELTYQRGLPHHNDYLEKVASKDGCTLYLNDLVPADLSDEGDMFHYIDYDCNYWADQHGVAAEGQYWCAADQECIRHADDDPYSGTECLPLPAHTNLGDITITGLSTAVSLAADELDRYYPNGDYPADLFDANSDITATTSGGPLDSFSLNTTGVSHLELGNSGELDLEAGQREVTWTPAGDGSQVQVVIQSGSHDPNPVLAALVCEAPDSAGKITIPDDLVQQVHNNSYGFYIKCNSATRYRRAITNHTGGQIELFVGSARNLKVTFPAYQGW